MDKRCVEISGSGCRIWKIFYKIENNEVVFDKLRPKIKDKIAMDVDFEWLKNLIKTENSVEQK